MSDRLHPFLLVLTLLDLAFVHLTGAVSAAGLLPMWALALLSPRLRRLQRFALYRALWNGCVLLLFALLAHHAASTGLANLLEDGLLLAALCQVHLLNNVGARQQPDLVFLNSLLIAFVTSLFGAEAPWFALFAVHAFVLVPALQVWVHANRGAAPPEAVRAALRSGLRQAAAVATCTVVVFALWPRDFDRTGWLHEAVARSLGLSSGIGESIRLDVGGAAPPGGQVIMRITPATRGAAVPTHWRSVAFSGLVDGAWLPQNAWNGRRLATDPLWRNDPDGVFRRPLRADGPELHVALVSRSERRLPVPLAACELRLLDGRGLVVDPRPYGVLAIARIDEEADERLEYVLRAAREPEPRPVDPTARHLLVALHDGELTALAHELDARRRAEPGAVTGDLETTARACADWLRANRSYLLPGRPGFAANFRAFLRGEGAGHCEYFASTLALMLRQQDIPARVIGGYLATEHEPSGAVVVRARHAHAWVEVLRPDGTWLTLDATPASAAGTDEAGGSGWWSWPADGLRSLWGGVADFDEEARQRLFASLAAVPGTLARLARDHAPLSATLLALPGLWILLRRRRRRLPFAVVSLLRAARGAGLRLRTGETPRELLTRARVGAVAGDRIAALMAAVRQHERQRYRGSDEVGEDATDARASARPPRRVIRS